LRTRLGQEPNDLLDAFASEASSLDDDTRRFWENRLRNLFQAFLLAMREVRRRGTPFGDDPLTRAQHYIHAHYTRANLTVEQVADAAGCTPTHLAHIFRRELDATVRQTIIDCRLRTARRLLETGRYLVKEAAFLSGWRSPHHFSNTFASRYGIRPAELLLAASAAEPPDCEQ
jgi:AraC-like DNA-binding protein